MVECVFEFGGENCFGVVGEWGVGRSFVRVVDY